MSFKVIAISGSLERNAANSGLIRACLLVNNPHLEIEVADISSFPLFNMDTVIQQGYPPQVQKLRQKIAHAHAILFSTPQHNFKVSAALKNAYDWISFTQNIDVPPPIKYMECAIMCSSLSGGAKAIEHMKKIFDYCKVKPMQNCLQVQKTAQNFDDHGNVKCKQLMQEVENFLNNFVAFLQLHKNDPKNL